MQQRALSPGIRVVAGIVGVTILIITLFVAATQVRAGSGSDPRAWAAAVALLLLAIAAIRLVRAALRGTITVRGVRS